VPEIDHRAGEGLERIVHPADALEGFSPGGWQMRPQGKQIIAKMASQLAPTQQSKLLVNGYTDNTPIGPGLKQLFGPTCRPVGDAAAQGNQAGGGDTGR
jgi:hypothetical protein